MRLFINIVLLLTTLFIFSGCVTMKVSEMEKKRSVDIFNVEKIASAYYNKKEDKVFLHLDLKYIEKKEITRECFYFQAYKFKQSITLEEKYKTSCFHEGDWFTYLPILTDEDAHIPQYNVDGILIYLQTPVNYYNEYSLLKDFPGAVMIHKKYDGEIENKLYLVSIKDKRKRTSYSRIEIPYKIERRNTKAYLLYPFSLTIDIVTFPITAPFYIFYWYMSEITSVY